MKELEKTSKEQSLMISEILGNDNKASVSMVDSDNGKEIYKAYSMGDLIDLLVKPAWCYSLSMCPFRGPWRLTYSIAGKDKLQTLNVINTSLIHGLFELVVSVYKIKPHLDVERK